MHLKKGQHQIDVLPVLMKGNAFAGRKGFDTSNFLRDTQPDIGIVYRHDILNDVYRTPVRRLCVQPVSYTHLDVYKRQVKTLPLLNRFNIFRRFQ